uniref:Uncharacterized protein n=1 Tax=Pelusios castaneus TaxID=367368 RepID=A0A8C8SI98_9SAUR
MAPRPARALRAGHAGSCSPGGRGRRAAGQAADSSSRGAPRGCGARAAVAGSEETETMSVQVAAPGPAVELKELGGPRDKGARPAEPGPPQALAAGEREAAAGCGAERPLSGCPGLAAAGLPPGAVKVPQASAMKRSDPHHPQHRLRDGGEGGREALVSPDGSVSEAPRTVKKVPAPAGRGTGPGLLILCV